MFCRLRFDLLTVVFLVMPGKVHKKKGEADDLSFKLIFNQSAISFLLQIC